MTSHDPLAYLEDILVSAKLASEYAASLTFQEFVDDIQKQDAVIHRLQIIGEAAGKLPSEISAAIPDVPWSRMKGMRNLIAHHYWSIDLKTVWSVVQEELSPLIAAIEAFNRSER